MILQDDRIKYEMGREVKDPMQEAINNLMGLGVSKEEVNIIQNNTMSSPEVRKIINRVEKETGAEPGNVFSVFNMIAKKEKEERAGMKDGGEFPDLNKDGEVTYADVLKGRGVFQKGGLLNIANKIIEDTSEDVGYSIYQNYTPDKKTKIDSNEIDRMNNYLYEIYEKEVEEGRTGNAKRIAKRIDILEKEKIKLESSRNKKQEGGSIDDQMMMVMTPPMESEMEPDGEMEDNYTRFIMDEALTEEEEDMLMSKLEQDEELAMIFDKVIDVAQEFAGAGPVEGPGSGVSDSIPARLSDGEFVFTAKAVEEIGADNLMAMMKDAEMKADERQGLVEGGLLEQDRVVMEPEKEPMQQDIRVTKETTDSIAAVRDEEDLVGDTISEEMIRRSRYI